MILQKLNSKKPGFFILQESPKGSIDTFRLWRITWKNYANFLSNFFVAYLGYVIIKINKSQKISACYVKYILFALQKIKQKGSIDPFGPSRVNTEAKHSWLAKNLSEQQSLLRNWNHNYCLTFDNCIIFDNSLQINLPLTIHRYDILQG